VQQLLVGSAIEALCDGSRCTMRLGSAMNPPQLWQ